MPKNARNFQMTKNDQNDQNDQNDPCYPKWSDQMTKVTKYSKKYICGGGVYKLKDFLDCISEKNINAMVPWKRSKLGRESIKNFLG